jgi:hypothetical protein
MLVSAGVKNFGVRRLGWHWYAVARVYGWNLEDLQIASYDSYPKGEGSRDSQKLTYSRAFPKGDPIPSDFGSCYLCNCENYSTV